MHDRETLQKRAVETLKSIDRDNLKPRDRMAIPLQDMPAQDPDVRITNMSEVALGYSAEQAVAESLRDRKSVV